MDYKVNMISKAILNDNKLCFGHINWDYHTIDIDKTLQDSQGLEETFLHELIHGIIHERNLILQDADEEFVVDELARGLHQVIKDNPKVFIIEKEWQPTYSGETNPNMSMTCEEYLERHKEEPNV